MRTSYNRVVEDIKIIRKPQIVFESWSGLFYTSWWKNHENIKGRIQEIYEAIEGNSEIEKVVMVCDTCFIVLPFKLHKKVSLWNKAAFSRADIVVEMKCGIPIQIKPTLKVLECAQHQI